MTEYDLPVMIAIAGTFLLAGGVKGVIGLGLPTVSLGLLTAVLDLPSAMALMVVPSLITNIWQAVAGGGVFRLARRLWPFLLLATLTIAFGGLAFAHVNLQLLSLLLGALLIAYATLNLLGVRIQLNPTQERWAGPAFGISNGVLTGMTGSFVVPGVMYLQAIGLPRDQLVQAMGLLFTLSTLGVAAALQGNQLWTANLGLVSLAAVIPALLGMVAGQKLRQKLSEAAFRRIFFVSVWLLGAYIIATTAWHWIEL